MLEVHVSIMLMKIRFLSSAPFILIQRTIRTHMRLFKQFADAINAKFRSLGNQLFLVNIPRDQLWQAYQGAYTPAQNPILGQSMTPIIYALQNKLRFPTTSGNLSVEQLFDLPITSAKGVSLSAIAIDLATTLTLVATLDFLKTAPTNTIDQIKFDVVKFIIQLKQEQSAIK